MTELVWVLVAMFEPKVGQPSFYAFDDFVQQNELPAKRFQAHPEIRALVVPMGPLCDSNKDVQCTIQDGQPMDISETAVIVLSSSITPPELDALVSSVRQVDTEPDMIVAMPAFPKTPRAGMTKCCGSITLRAHAGEYSYALYRLPAKKPSLRMSPEAMRKMPEDKDYLQDRESWFQERYKKPE